MSDYSSYTEIDAFNEALCNLVEEYFQDKDAFPKTRYSLSTAKQCK